MRQEFCHLQLLPLFVYECVRGFQHITLRSVPLMVLLMVGSAQGHEVAVALVSKLAAPVDHMVQLHVRGTRTGRAFPPVFAPVPVAPRYPMNGSYVGVVPRRDALAP